MRDEHIEGLTVAGAHDADDEHPDSRLRQYLDALGARLDLVVAVIDDDDRRTTVSGGSTDLVLVKPNRAVRQFVR